ncbi:MAG: FAD:protein FMN transferase [Defluviitaleaceae bacterium]|nr:FAD:protein FMN transferase [Defluviitaleaceae bacterium]
MKKLMTIIFMLAAGLLVFTACDSSSGEEGMHVVSDETYDGFETVSTVSIFYYGQQDNVRERGYRAIINESFDIIREMHNIFSRFDEGTDVWRINNAGGEWVEVSDHTIYVLQRSLEYKEMSNGGFDVTIGAVSRYWGFSGVNLPRGAMPTQQQLDEALPTVGTDIIIDGNRVRLAHPQAMLDLGAVAKGYTVDLIAELFNERGVAGIANMGGDTMLIGDRPDGGHWGIGLRLPFAAQMGLPLDTHFGIVRALGSTSALTSAVDQRNFMMDGNLYHHILDTTTGRPIETNIVSVTVMAETGILGEGITTAIFALGPAAGMQLVESMPGVEAVIFVEYAVNPVLMSSGLSQPGGRLQLETAFDNE